jgi:hypothetical protein
MKKICTCCGLERDAEEDFKWRYKNQGIRQPRCKYCQSELSRRHYQNNKQAYNKRSRAYKERVLAENTALISAYLSIHPCVDCGQVDIRVLEFDHMIGQKLRSIADLLTSGATWPVIEAEIAKCEVRCANCHRIRTIEQGRGWRSTHPLHQTAKSYQMVQGYLSEHPCVDCGCSDIRVLEFDHVRGSKMDGISHLLSQGYNWLAIDAEIAKCEVRCANCHRIKTGEHRGFWRNLLDV